MLAVLVLAGDLATFGGVRLPAANAADTCQWPTVVSFRAGEEKCSGVLVDPHIVVTAAHCLASGMPDRVRFGESFQPMARSVDVQTCWTHDSEDLAACRLVAPVDAIPATPLLDACASADAIAPDRDVVLVGFGIESATGSFGTKRYAFTRFLSSVRSDGTFIAGDAQVNGCDGDSGGPAFVQRSDGTWYVAGILSSGPPCGEGPSRWVATASHLDWLQSVTGVDLTPCRDDDDAWQTCRVAGDPLDATASWDRWCDGTRVTAIDTCETTEGSTTTGATDPANATDSPPDTTAHGRDDARAEPTDDRVGCRTTGPPSVVWIVALGVMIVAAPRSSARRCTGATNAGCKVARAHPRRRY